MLKKSYRRESRRPRPERRPGGFRESTVSPDLKRLVAKESLAEIRRSGGFIEFDELFRKVCRIGKHIKKKIVQFVLDRLCRKNFLYRNGQVFCFHKQFLSLPTDKLVEAAL